MLIFNVEINGADERWFCHLPRQEKIDWIKSNTNVQDESQIEEFLTNPPRLSITGCCGKKKVHVISQASTDTHTTSPATGQTSGNGKGNHSKRPGRA